MWRSRMGTRAEILSCVLELGNLRQQELQAVKRKSSLARQEVGEVHSSVEALVMRSGAKEPYLVEVNREGKEM